jgi:hypothetical protein
MITRWLNRLLILGVLFIFAAFANSASNTRIVAVGDVHGAFDGFVTILQEAKVINSKNHWSGGSTILVQTGDTLDRGPDSRKVMELLMVLEKVAPKQKGKIVPLLGNHEAMILIGDLRYVSAEEYASYSDSGSVKRQESAYKTYQNFLKQRLKELGKEEPAFTREDEDKWKKEHPPGFIEHREAFAASGKYGKWLRKLNAIQMIDSSIFMHGGISPSVSELSIDQLNRRIQQEIRILDGCSQVLQQRKAALPFFTMEENLEAARGEIEILKKRNSDAEASTTKQLEECSNIGSWLIIHQDGPLWFRGFSQWNDTEGAEHTKQLFEKYKAKRFVTGHSVQNAGQINARFDAKIILIDTGMLDGSFYPGGRASALEIVGDTITAIYAGKREPIGAE